MDIRSISVTSIVIVCCLVCVLLGLHACDKERENPLDPSNPVDPFNVNTHVDSADVTITWDTIGVGGITGYRVIRSQLRTGPDSLIAEVHSTQHAASDPRIRAGQSYFYRVAAVDSDGSESRRSEPDSLEIPFPFLWIGRDTARLITSAGSLPPPDTLTIGNDSGWVLHWSAFADVSWLQVSPQTGKGNRQRLVIAVDSLLPVGRHEAKLTVADSFALNSPQSVAVILDVSAQAPRLTIDPATISYVAAQNGPPPSPQSIAISNAGGGTLQWSVTDSGTTWLSQSPLSATGNATVACSVLTTNKPPATYQSKIWVHSSNADNSPESVLVTYTVQPRPQLHVDVDSLSFSAVVTGPLPHAQTVVLTNAGGLIWPLNWSASGANLTVTPNGGDDNYVELSVHWNTTGLAPGTYSSDLVFTSTNAANSPETVVVTTTIAPLCSEGQTVIVPGTINEIRAADLNNDGYEDIVVATSEGLGVLRNVAGVLAPIQYVLTTASTSITIGDVTEDGLLDILCTADSFRVLHAKGNYAFDNAQTLPPTIHHPVLIATVRNYEAQVDFLCMGYNGFFWSSVDWYAGIDGMFWYLGRVDSLSDYSDEMKKLVKTDFDEVAYLTYKGTIGVIREYFPGMPWEADSRFERTTETYYDLCMYAPGVFQPADFDLDGDSDIFTGAGPAVVPCKYCSGEIGVMVNPVWSSGVISHWCPGDGSAFTALRAIVIKDLNLDVYPDVVALVERQTEGQRALFFKGNGVASGFREIDVGLPLSDPLLGVDLDRDGDMDLIVRETEAVRVFLNEIR